MSKRTYIYPMILLSTIAFGAEEVLKLKKASEEFPLSHDAQHHHDHGKELSVVLKEPVREIPQTHSNVATQSTCNISSEGNRPIFVPIADGLCGNQTDVLKKALRYFLLWVL